MNSGVSRQTQELEEMRESISHSKTAKAVADKVGNFRLACVMVLVSQTFWVISFIYPNEHNFNLFETGLVRGLATSIINFLICYKFSYDVDFKPSVSPIEPLNIRNFIITIQGIGITYVQFYLPLPVVHIIGCSGSIFIAVIDYLRFGVKLNSEQIKGIAIGFFGLMIVINDDLILYFLGFQIDSSSDFQNYKTNNIWITTAAALIYVGITIMWAYAIVQTKMVKNCNTYQINFHLGICILVSSALLYPLNDHEYQPIPNLITAVFLTAVPMVLGQIMFIAAFSITEQHGKLSVMLFGLVVIAYAISILRYHEAVNKVAVIGTIFAVFGILKCVLNKD